MAALIMQFEGGKKNASKDADVIVKQEDEQQWRPYPISFREERDTFGPIQVPSDKFGI